MAVKGDTGLTGRKIIVDTYGGYARHGGGAFSGKDVEIDHQASYMAIYCEEPCCCGVADKLEIGLSYVIGMGEPTSIMVNSFGTSRFLRRNCGRN